MIEIDNYLNRLQKDNFVIFLFHGVVHNSDYEVRNYTKKHILSSEFEELIKRLIQKGNPISMEEIIFYKQNNNKYPPFSYAITFDDGFENNYTIAAPILDFFQQKAIFYISTDLVENNTITWTDRAEFCLENVRAGSVKFPWENETIKFSDAKSKISLMKYLRYYLKSNLDVNANEVVDSLYEKFKIDEEKCGHSELDKKLNWNQVRALSNNTNFIVAGHSHQHLSLTSLSEKELEHQVDTSIRLLLDKGGVESHHYCYPEGQEIDYSEDVINLLKSKGIKCCPTAIDGVNNEETDLFNLKRIIVD